MFQTSIFIKKISDLDVYIFFFYSILGRENTIHLKLKKLKTQKYFHNIYIQDS